MKKRGQFFLLAAVIISTFIITLGMSANYAVVAKNPDSLADFSYHIKSEAGGVIDYQIYSDFSDNTNLSEFVNLVANDMRDSNPDTDLLFIYGTNETVTIKNFGKEDAFLNETTLPGASTPIQNKITATIGGTILTQNEITPLNGNSWQTTLSDKNTVSIKVYNQEYNFNLAKNNQVILIVKKETPDETTIEIK